MKKITAFEDLLKPLTNNLLEKAVEIHSSDERYRSLKSKEHLFSLIFAQILEIRSLRDLETALSSNQRATAAIGNTIKKSTLSDANKNRPAGFFMYVAEKLLSILPKKLSEEIDMVIRLLDSSPIQIKGEGYDDWTKENKTRRCQGIKLHVEYDLMLGTPVRVMTTPANIDDCRAGQSWPIEKNTVYVFDKGYYDYNWWWSINQQEAYFVTRLKKNGAVDVISRQKVEGDNIVEDNIIRFKNKNPRGGKKNLYSAELRQIVVKREEKKTDLVIVTNILDKPAETIALLYKARWQIELFFKWLKQNLKIKKFLGKSSNAVNIQIAVAIITYVLIYLLKGCMKKNYRLKSLLVWIKVNYHLVADTIDDGPCKNEYDTLYRLTLPWHYKMDVRL